MRKILLFITLFSISFFCTSASIAVKTEADIDQILKKGEIIPISVTGDKNNRINILFVNKWGANDQNPYNKPELREEYIKDIENSLIAALTDGDPRAQTAYSHYKQFFNVYAFWWPDVPEWEKGFGMKDVEAIVSKLFLPWPDEHLGWATALAMPNSESGGGGAARNLEERKGSADIAGNGIGKMLHEISHTAFSLGDEYTAEDSGFLAQPTYNCTIEHRKHRIKWRAFIDDDTPLPTPYTKEYENKVGAFEGCQYHVVGYYRSTAQHCIMGSGIFDNTEEMCPICNQRVVMRIYNLVNPINSFLPSDKNLQVSNGEKVEFSIDHIVPVPNTQVVRWYINGKLIDEGTDKTAITFGGLPSYEVKCVLTDESPYIRVDPPFGAYPQRTVVWNVKNKKVDIDKFPMTVSIAKKGNQLAADVKGGVAPYSFKWNSGKTSDAVEGTKSGKYVVTVFDSQMRKAVASRMIYDNAPVKGIAKEAVYDSALCVKVVEDNFKNYGKNVVYEAENAATSVKGAKQKEHWYASGDHYMQYGETGSVTFEIETGKSGHYPIEFIYAPVTANDLVQFTVNGKHVVKTSLDNTLSLYTGWDKIVFDTYLEKGKNEIKVTSTEGSLPNIDYLRVPDTYYGEQIYKAAETAPAEALNTATCKIPSDVRKLFDSSLLLRFDASDLDMDGQADTRIPERGPVKEWKSYTKEGIQSMFIKYEPAVLNGRGVGSFETLWLTGLKYKPAGFQTIVQVYKECEMSGKGSSLTMATNPYIGYSGDPKVLLDKKTTSSKVSDVYINGRKVNPFTTPNPMDFAIMTVELSSPAEENISAIDGMWEGQIAEFLVFDRKLSDSERKSLESYLKEKWFNGKF